MGVPAKLWASSRSGVRLKRSEQDKQGITRKCLKGTFGFQVASKAAGSGA